MLLFVAHMLVRARLYAYTDWIIDINPNNVSFLSAAQKVRRLYDILSLIKKFSSYRKYFPNCFTVDLIRTSCFSFVGKISCSCSPCVLDGIGTVSSIEFIGTSCEFGTCGTLDDAKSNSASKSKSVKRRINGPISCNPVAKRTIIIVT